MAGKKTAGKGHFDEPAESEPDERLLPIYLRNARPTQHDVIRDGAAKVEAGRVEANRALAAIYRKQLAKKRVDLELKAFFDDVNAHIWSSTDPLAVLEAFLEPKKRRGAKLKTAYRNHLFAVEVGKRRANGETKEEACRAIADEAIVSVEVVRNAYDRENKREVKASLAL